MTLTSASCALVVNIQAFDGFARISHILIVLSTEQLAKTYAGILYEQHDQTTVCIQQHPFFNPQENLGRFLGLYEIAIVG